MPTAAPLRKRSRLPLWLKIAFTIFLGVLIWRYWPVYGPADFLWFCDVAAILTLVALWLESPLLAGANAVGMTLPQTIWIIDFLSGGRLLGISAYMFDADIPLFVRALSTFHIWLPFLLIWMVWRLGYDRRAFALQTIICAAVLLASYLLTDPRHPPVGYPDAAVNVNRVFGPRVTQVQTWMPGWAYLVLQIVLYSLLIYLPTHLVFRRIFAPRARARAELAA
ncbi:MAG TPA: hypothetical protein VN541_23030 [Tepidisphaeraceae bacterium]|nr:hypothetical protein [Tepidisphaeraceae bacterium]